MQENQRVADMAAEVLARQAEARAEWTGEPLDEALKAVLETEAANSLRGCETGHTATRRRNGGTMSLRRSGPRSEEKLDKRSVVGWPAWPNAWPNQTLLVSTLLCRLRCGRKTS